MLRPECAAGKKRSSRGPWTYGSAWPKLAAGGQGMSSFLIHPIAASFLLGLIGPPAAQSTHAGDPDPRLTVIVFNYANVPAAVLAEAQGFAEKVFQHAGVGIEWIQPSDTVALRDGEESRNSSRLVMRLVPNSMIGGWASQHDLLGFSLVPADGGMGFIAGAYYQRVQQLSQRLGCRTALVLGYVVAHELGHLVLGAQSHFPSGIMSYPFDRKELRLASQGLLRFTPSQSNKIREMLQATYLWRR
jgi:hypothetical protein